MSGSKGFPRLGEERFAGDLVRTPGGGAITAIGTARLGLSTALAAPLGQDAAGDLIGPMLTDEGIQLAGWRCPRTPITVVMPIGDERSMVTFDPGVRARAADVAAVAPRAVITGLSQLDVVPGGARAFVTVGDDDARAFAGRLPGAASRATGVFIEQREALVLTGAGTPEEAAEMIGARVPIVAVFLGAGGAVASIEGRAVSVKGFDVGPPVDTTGAGDLFVAAWAWGDSVGPLARRRAAVGDALRRAGRPRADRLRRRRAPRRVHGGGRPPRAPDARRRAPPRPILPGWSDSARRDDGAMRRWPVVLMIACWLGLAGVAQANVIDVTRHDDPGGQRQLPDRLLAAPGDRVRRRRRHRQTCSARVRRRRRTRSRAARCSSPARR